VYKYGLRTENLLGQASRLKLKQKAKEVNLQECSLAEVGFAGDIEYI
jgi:hypothetical protein